jgi:type II pantothenate kinase
MEAAGADRRSCVGVGVDVGLSVTDAVLVHAHHPTERPLHVRFDTAGRAPAEALRAALEALGPLAARAPTIGVTGGRSATLADVVAGTTGREADHDDTAAALVVVAEPEAVGRGGLQLAGLRRALVVSCGTGTSMIHADADAGRYRHATGTPVGGGALRALGALLLGERDAHAIASLATAGDTGRVDTTLGEVLGGGLGTLPAEATAVSFGRLADAVREVRREDLAAALVTMIAQTIGIIAVNAVRAQDLEAVVMVGRLASLSPIPRMVSAVFDVYGLRDVLHLPAGAAQATALGAALAARERRDHEDRAA